MAREVLFAVCVSVCLLGATTTANARSPDWQKLNVAATAYNSVPSQTTRKNPALAAWGAKLKPGMNVIAVSRDLLKKGLKRGTKVRIQGLPGVYVVRDKMAARWKNKIDIYMGHDVAAARDWGVRHDIQIMYAENS